MKKIAIIYSFNSGKTSQAARKIGEALGEPLVEHINAEDLSASEFLRHDLIIMGVPTWFDGELPNYWDEFVPALEDMDLKGKKVALFGNGDQLGYPENFVDAMGIMAQLLEKQGATLIGFTSTEGYAFESSKAARGDQFTGLALDFENQGSQVNGRIRKWAAQLRSEMGL